MDLASLLPPRSVEDILAERVRLSIGGQEYHLPALVIARNEAWKAKLDAEMTALLARAQDEDDPGKVLEALAADTAPFLDLLYLYDETGVLPDRETVRSSLTELGLLSAVLEVWRAANPLVDIGLDAWAMTLIQANEQRERSRGWRRNTDGRSASSGPN